MPSQRHAKTDADADRDADARQTTCPANTVYAQLCLESAQYGRMCRAWLLPYGDGQEFVAQYDQMPGGEYTMYARY